MLFWRGERSVGMITNIAMSKGYSKDDRWARRPSLANIVIESKAKDFQICHKFVLIRAVIDNVVEVLVITVLEGYDHSFDENREIAQVFSKVDD